MSGAGRLWERGAAGGGGGGLDGDLPVLLASAAVEGLDEPVLQRALAP